MAIGLLPEELADCTVTGGNTALSGAAMVGSRILTAGGKQTAEGTLPDGGMTFENGRNADTYPKSGGGREVP